MSERINIEVDDAQIVATIALLDSAIAKSGLILGGMGGVGSLEPQLVAQSQRLDDILLQAGGLDKVLFDIETKIDDVEPWAKKLPQVDRASRMVLLRIPLLREALQTLYRIKMLERTLRLGEIRGPVTAALAISIYLYMTVQQILAWKERIEARQRALEKDLNLRLITLEEALRGYGTVPERYRSSITI